MAEKMDLVCETCLCNDRLLVATSRIVSILREIRCEELDNKLICWECRSVIIKFHTFKTQVKQVQSMLCEKNQNFKSLSKLMHSTKQSYDFEFVHAYNLFTNEDNKEENLESYIKCENYYETLDSHSYDYENDDKKCILPLQCNEKTHSLESLLNSNEETTPKEIVSKKKSHNIQKKLLTKDKLEENQDLLEENREEEESSKKTEKIAKTSKKKCEISELRNKFEIIFLTKEELLKSREEKRNHPNYKKLPYKCDSCVLGFTKNDNYDMHVEKKHNEVTGPDMCDVCSVRFVSPTSLARHSALHFTRYACSLCAYITTTLTAVANHCRYKHANDERDSIHCKQCAAVFRTSEELSDHTQSEHTLYCKECGEKFKGKHTLRAHRVRIHTVKRKFTCDICKRTFQTKSRLESHVVRHSRALAQRLAYCAVCEIQYKNIQVYRNHVQNNKNHAQNRYQCPECNKKFASRIYQKRHYNFYHLKKSQYKCHSCNKLFISAWRLTNHRQKHHGVPRARDHGCDQCGKRFYTSSSLAVHGSTHSPSRRHLCACCGAQYRQPAALYSHERRAHSKQ